MAVFRVDKTRDYTVMSNHHLRDQGLSLKAKGLLSQILSLPEGWDYTIAGLAKINREGKDAIRAAVAELEQAGYIQRRQTTGANGTFASNEYIVFEQPQTAAPLSENPTTDNPTTENPLTGNPLTENPTQLNKDISSKDNNPLNPPEGEQPRKKRSRGCKDQAEVLPERFENFWNFYRRHVPEGCRPGNRQKAIRAWDNLAPSDELVTVMAMGLAVQVQSAAWISGVGVPHASTWLNNRGWEDDWGPGPERPPETPPGGDREWL